MEQFKIRKLKRVALLTFAAVGSAAPAWADIDPNEGAVVSGSCGMDPNCDEGRFFRDLSRIIVKTETKLDAVHVSFSDRHERRGRSAADSLSLYYKVEVDGANAVLDVDVVGRGEYWDDVRPGHFKLTSIDDATKPSRRFVYSGGGASITVMDGVPVSIAFGEYGFAVASRPSRESVRRIDEEEDDMARDRMEISSIRKAAEEAAARVAEKAAAEEATRKATEKPESKKRSRFLTWLLGPS